MGSRQVDIVVARAIQLAMAPTFDAHAVACELLETSRASWPVLRAAKLRVDRALAERWSRVAGRASDALRVALESLEARPLVAAS